MKFLIIGIGSVGGFLGFKLVKSGKDVTFLVREQRKNEIDEKGITVIQHNKTASVKVRALSSINETDRFDVVIISVRNSDLESLKDTLIMLRNTGSKFISLLNGVRHIDYLTPLVGLENLIGGSASMETRRDDNGNIIFISQEPTITIGSDSPDNAHMIADLKATFHKAGFKVIIKDSVYQSVWEKYLFNLACNMTAVFSATVKEIKENRYAMASVINLVNEAFSLSAKMRVGLENGSKDFAINNFLAMRDDFKSLMAEDIMNNRNNESEFLFGYLARLCENNGKNCPTINVSYAVLALKSRRRPTDHVLSEN
ncbi:MAG: ketopantoate reductase family protein [Thermoplasmata archaeon]